MSHRIGSATMAAIKSNIGVTRLAMKGFPACKRRPAKTSNWMSSGSLPGVNSVFNRNLPNANAQHVCRTPVTVAIMKKSTQGPVCNYFDFTGTVGSALKSKAMTTLCMRSKVTSLLNPAQQSDDEQ